MKARVFENSDGSVRIMRLNEKMRLPGELDEAFAARMFPIEQSKDVSLSNLAFSDVDIASLPPGHVDRKDWKRKMIGGTMRVMIVKPQV